MNKAMDRLINAAFALLGTFALNMVYDFTPEQRCLVYLLFLIHLSQK